jgi:hypothetical protein
LIEQKAQQAMAKLSATRSANAGSGSRPAIALFCTWKSALFVD